MVLLGAESDVGNVGPRTSRLRDVVRRERLSPEGQRAGPRPKGGTVDVRRVTGTRGWKGKPAPELMSL